MASYNDITPWSIQVEVVQGCCRRCWFCGIRGVPPEKAKGDRYMSLDILDSVFSQLRDWLPQGIRVELNSHGEPTLHPDFLAVLATIRTAMPKAYITLQTNSEPWFTRAEEYIPNMFAAGLNSLILNCYKKGMADQFREMFNSAGTQYVDYFRDPKAPSYSTRYGVKAQLIFLLDDLGQNASANHKVNKILHNSGGNSSPDAFTAHGLPYPAALIKSKCSKVYREIILGWDGTIPICCQDWNDETVMGNVCDTPIRDIWYSDRWNAARQLLFRRRRDLLTPCMNCSDPTNRVGLLPAVQDSRSDLELYAILSPSNNSEKE